MAADPGFDTFPGPAGDPVIADPPVDLRSTHRDPAALLAAARTDAGWTLQRLAEASGVSKSALSAYECGRRQPPWPVLCQALAALGRQPLLATEPLHADIDAAIDRLAKVPVDQRWDQPTCDGFPAMLAGIAAADWVVEGAAAAALLGAPVPVGRLDLALSASEASVAAFVTWGSFALSRWSARWKQFGYEPVDPRIPGSADYLSNFGRLRVRLVGTLPPHVTVRLAELTVRVASLETVLADDGATARILARVLARQGDAPG